MSSNRWHLVRCLVKQRHVVFLISLALTLNSVFLFTFIPANLNWLSLLISIPQFPLSSESTSSSNRGFHLQLLPTLPWGLRGPGAFRNGKGKCKLVPTRVGRCRAGMCKCNRLGRGAFVCSRGDACVALGTFHWAERIDCHFIESHFDMRVGGEGTSCESY